MYTSNQSAQAMYDAMHIYPSLTEVAQRAFQSIMTSEEYQHHLERDYHVPFYQEAGDLTALSA